MAKIKYQLPPRMVEVFEWVAAIDAWELCEPAPLQALIEREPIPVELKPTINAIIGGAKKPNKRAAAKLKMDPTRRLYLGKVLYIERHFAEWEKTQAPSDAELAKVEANTLIREKEKNVKNILTLLAKASDVSEDAVESAYKALLEKIKKWPVL